MAVGWTIPFKTRTLWNATLGCGAVCGAWASAALAQIEVDTVNAPAMQAEIFRKSRGPSTCGYHALSEAMGIVLSTADLVWE